MNGACTRKPTMVIIAAAFSQLHILHWLLEGGADPNISDVLIAFSKFIFNQQSPIFFLSVFLLFIDILSILLL